MKKLVLQVVCFLASLFSAPILAFDLARQDIQSLINEGIATYNLDRDQVVAILKGAQRQDRILELMEKAPERTKEWFEYRDLFINNDRIARGRAFINEHHDELARVAENTGVPASIIVAILGVETHYGRQTGGFRVLDALTTLAFDYPPRQEFFAKELWTFLALSQKETFDANQVRGSYAGAIGAAQFMPSSYRDFACDGDGDGHIDMWSNWPDIFASIANYLSKHGWQTNQAILIRATLAPEADLSMVSSREPRSLVDLATSGWIPEVSTFSADTTAIPLLYTTGLGPDGQRVQEAWFGMNNFYTITRYNRSVLYARAIIELASALETSTQENQE